MKVQRIEPGTKVPVRLTHEQRDLILDHTLAGRDLTDRLRVAEADGKRIVVQYDLDDLDELLGYIAAEANHSKDKKLQKKLYGLFDLLRRIEDSYTDQD